MSGERCPHGHLWAERCLICEREPAERPTRSEEPSERLTRLCAAMTDALDAHPERGDEKCIVFLQDSGPGGSGRGGIALHGYDDDADAMVDLLVHLRSIFRANGKELHVVSVGEG